MEDGMLIHWRELLFEVSKYVYYDMPVLQLLISNLERARTTVIIVLLFLTTDC